MENEEGEDGGESSNGDLINPTSMKRAEEDGEATPEELRSWYFYDFANSPYYQVMTTLFPFFMVTVATGYADSANSDTMPGINITPKSFPALIRFTMIALQLVSILTFSALGDFGPHKKNLLKILTTMGSAFLILNIFTLSYSLWWLPAILRILSGICFCLCCVYYNAYMPLLAAAHPSVIALPPGDDHDKKETECSDEISNKGQGFGYLGGLLVLGISIGILLLTECGPSTNADTMDAAAEKEEAVAGKTGRLLATGDSCTATQKVVPLTMCFAVVGVWWFACSLYTFRHLKERAGPDVPEGVNILCFGWKEAASTVRLLYVYKNMGIFMVSYFLLSDAFSTTLDLIVYCMGEGPEVKPSTILIQSVQGVLLGIVGTFFFFWLQPKIGISAKTMLVAQLVTYAIITTIIALYGAPLFASGDDAPPFWHYALIMLPVVLMLGSVQAYARSIFSSLVPAGKESAFFAFYAFTDKGSALLGNAVTGVYAHHTKEYAGVFWYCVGMYLLSIVLLLRVNVEEGIEDANHHADEESSEEASEDEC